jgi:ATP-dependent RNA helicase DeaD
MANQFSELGISNPLIQVLNELKIVEPTEIQQKVIPQLLANTTDIVGLAKTGTGKTAAFGLPLLQLIQIEKANIQAVILVPTRELGHQIHTNLEQFSKNINGISIAATCGGIPIKPQIERLKTPTHIVVATPGRLIDLIQRKAIDLKDTQFLVLDEADEMVSI